MLLFMTNLRELRKSAGLLLKDAAALLDTDPGNLSRIERGSQMPSIDLAWRMADLYAVPLDRVLPKPSDGKAA